MQNRRLLLVILGLLAACSGSHALPDTQTPDGGIVDMTVSPSTVTTPLSPALTTGGAKLSCAPSDGIAGDGSALAPACSFVATAACTADAACGCGCTCDCGVCNCNAPAAIHTCSSDADCGVSCTGLTCSGGTCVPKTSGNFTGTWNGTMSWPTTVYEGVCGQGVGASSGTGMTTGPFEVAISGDGKNLVVQLTSQQSSGQPLCQLPFIVEGNTASLVAGSTCVTAGLGNGCPTAQSNALPVAIQTFLGGTMTLDGGSLSLNFSDVSAQPTEQGPECDTVPAGDTQVNVETLTATMTKSS